jgi:hypothetical protein
VFLNPLAFALLTNQTAKVDLIQYGNGRFEFTVGIPRQFVKGPEPENGDGATFNWRTASGPAKILVWGQNNANEVTPALALKTWSGVQKDEGFSITYKLVRKDFFVASGKSKKGIFYVKGWITPDVNYYAYFEYPKALKPQFDKIIPAVTKSFKIDP